MSRAVASRCFFMISPYDGLTDACSDHARWPRIVSVHNAQKGTNVTEGLSARSAALCAFAAWRVVQHHHVLGLGEEQPAFDEQTERDRERRAECSDLGVRAHEHRDD